MSLASSARIVQTQQTQQTQPQPPARVGAGAPIADAVLAAWLACHDFPAPQARGADGITPLMRAAAQGEPPVVDALLAAGARIDALDDAGNTALWYACQSHGAAAPAVIVRLIDAGIDIDHANDEDMTCLMQAAASGNVEVMQLLLAQGACPTLCAPDGRCARDMAADRSKQLLCATVRQNGACLRDIMTRRIDDAPVFSPPGPTGTVPT